MAKKVVSPFGKKSKPASTDESSDLVNWDTLQTSLTQIEDDDPGTLRDMHTLLRRVAKRQGIKTKAIVRFNPDSFLAFIKALVQAAEWLLPLILQLFSLFKK